MGSFKYIKRPPKHSPLPRHFDSSTVDDAFVDFNDVWVEAPELPLVFTRVESALDVKDCESRETWLVD